MQRLACYVCGAPLGDGPDDARYQSLKNRGYFARRDDAGAIVTECCDDCAFEIEDAGDEGGEFNVPPPHEVKGYSHFQKKYIVAQCPRHMV